MAEETITLKLVAQDLASGNISKAIGSIDKMAQRGGIVGSIFQGVGQSIGQMLNPLTLMHRGFDMVTDVIGDSIRAAAEEEASIARMTTAIQANDAGWDGNVAAIERVIDSRERLAVSDDAQRSSLSLLLGTTKDLTEAQDLQAIAMDLAIAKNMDLEAASKLLGKVYAGNLGGLAKAGIMIDKNATATEALAAIQKMAAGQQAAYADTTAGKLVTAQNELQNALEDLGKTLTPLAASFADFAADTIPDVVAALQALYDDALGPILDAIQLQDPAWGEWEDKIREAGAKAGLTSVDILALTDNLKLLYDAGLKNTEGLDEFARQTAVNKIVADALADALRHYTAATFEGAGGTHKLALSEEEAAAQAEAMGKAIEAVAGQSLPELRQSGRETLSEITKLLQQQGDPLRTLQRETSALQVLRERAFKQERYDIVAAIDQKLEELRVLKQQHRAVIDKYEDEAKGADIVHRKLDISIEKARTLWQQANKDYSIDVDVDTRELAHAIVLAQEFANRLSALQRTSIAESSYIGGLGQTPGESVGETKRMMNLKRETENADRRRREGLDKLRDALRSVHAETDATAEATGGGGSSGGGLSGANDKAAKSEKAHEEAIKAKERALEEQRKTAERVAAAFDYMATTSFPDLQTSSQEALDALRASLEQQIDPMQILLGEEQQLRDLRAQAAAQHRFDVMAAIDARLAEIEVQERQIKVVERRYQIEQDALDMLMRKRDVEMAQAVGMLERWRELDKYEGLTDIQIVRRQLQGRAMGGPVSTGRTYVVGERGPELVTMGGSGYVTPNSAIGSFIYAPMFSTASPAEAQRFAQAVTPYLERERRRIS